MIDAERAQFRAANEDKSIEELHELHNMRDRMIGTIREEQLILHDIQTAKEHVREKARSAGRGQTLVPGSIDDDMILSALEKNPGLLQRLLDRIKKDTN